VIGRVNGGRKNALLEKDTLRMVTGREPVTVTVTGCDETLPLEPLKLSAVVERLMLAPGFWPAHAGLAITIAQRGRRMWFFNATSPGIGD
jgi:hypothetical protein